ncbi:DUF4007 family protein [Ktedonobacter racemifer]|uniref:DUF4007 domain-containing protein n=1 Tax=Ktedonobacter racemifer DSM 44963 TaxID=485913 RepID=D6TX52_KTERA|nr:DUF4007 family protein [Ktedonobacter racemifer]EFH84785.1 conserved hypothetical protein [Ktedonobacter racemifer DSM 44963]
MSADLQNFIPSQSSLNDPQQRELDLTSLTIQHPQAAFARHETFHPRFGWIKKGFDRSRQNSNVFLKEDATTILGVGKNMVRSIRYWCSAFKVLAETQEKNARTKEIVATSFGARLLADDGWDPYIEDPASLWLLHWYLLKPPCIATTWYFAFACFKRAEFSVDSLYNALEEYIRQQFPKQNVAESSLQKDILCLLHMYVGLKSRSNAMEEMLDSPFTTLGLIQLESDGKHYSFHVGYKNTLPPEIIVVACLEFAKNVGKGERTISIPRLMYEEGSPGTVFKLTESALIDAIEQVTQSDQRLSLSNTAGIIQLAFTQHPTVLAESLLNQYYQHD